jgi:hypothetical protein
MQMRIFHRGLVALVVLGLAGSAAAAQAPVSQADIDQLETAASAIERQIEAMAPADPTLAAEAGRSLAELRDEVAYLRVKLRRESAVPRGEYTEVRDRLETLRVRVQGTQRVAAQPVLPADETGRLYTIPVGTELDVRLQTPLSSATAKPEERFEATTVQDLSAGVDVVVPAGSVVRGFVSSVRQAGRLDRTGSLTLSFDELIVGQRIARLRASVVRALDPSTRDDMTRIGAGAAIGAVIGGIFGGGKGALLGVLIGGGGTIASTEGTDVELPVGTVLRIRIDQPVEVWY